MATPVERQISNEYRWRSMMIDIYTRTKQNKKMKEREEKKETSSYDRFFFFLLSLCVLFNLREETDGLTDECQVKKCQWKY
jgi:hypothetical protein